MMGVYTYISTGKIERKNIMKLYKIYAKKILNNIGNEPEIVCCIGGKNKKNAVSSCLINHRHLSEMYKLDSFFAVLSNVAGNWHKENWWK